MLPLLANVEARRSNLRKGIPRTHSQQALQPLSQQLSATWPHLRRVVSPRVVILFREVLVPEVLLALEVLVLGLLLALMQAGTVLVLTTSLFLTEV